MSARNIGNWDTGDKPASPDNLMKQEHFTNSAQETQNMGKRLAQEILKSGKKGPSFAPAELRKGKPACGERRRAFVLALQGDLGGGKTTFLQGFALGLGIKEKILSPTFVILKRFQVSSFKFHDFYHIDCYRIQNPKEILQLGFEEIISNPKNIVAVEWAEKVKKILPKNALWLSFEFRGENERVIKLSS